MDSDLRKTYLSRIHRCARRLVDATRNLVNDDADAKAAWSAANMALQEFDFALESEAGLNSQPARPAAPPRTTKEP